jgi:hypothetical protein
MTFTLEPTLLLRGTRPAADYYLPCWPNVMTCEGGYSMWDNISRDLAALGYPTRPDRLISLTFQDEGRGGLALGGYNLAMGSIGMLTNYDKLSMGGTAHEMGHAFGLPHPQDVDGEYGVSVMGVGFYNFPRATFVDSQTNPERSHLLASPFINVRVPLADGGFEECESRWAVQGGMAACVKDGMQYSGLSGLRLMPQNGQASSISHAVTLKPGAAYDLTGRASSAQARVTVTMRAWSSDGTLIAETPVAARTLSDPSWEKIGGIYRAPEGGAKFEMTISLEAGSLAAIFDDFAVMESTLVPGATIPTGKNSGETSAGTTPLLQWLDTPNAPVYQVQIDSGMEFQSPLLDRMVSSPFFQTPEALLQIGRTYSWRVRAGNATGWGEWSPVWQIALRPESEYTGDEFPDGKRMMDPGWSWIRENPANWGFNGYPSTPQYGYLDIDIRGGDLAGSTNTAENILVRTPKDGDWAVDTYPEIWGMLSPEGQEGGMMIYRDDDNYCKLGRILSPNGYLLQWGCEIGGQLTMYDKTWMAGAFPIRIQRVGNAYSAFYSINGLEWRPMGNPVSPDWPDAQIALYAFGPIGSREPSTAYFDYFRYAFPL